MRKERRRSARVQLEVPFDTMELTLEASPAAGPVLDIPPKPSRPVEGTVEEEASRPMSVRVRRAPAGKRGEANGGAAGSRGRASGARPRERTAGDQPAPGAGREAAPVERRAAGGPRKTPRAKRDNGRPRAARGAGRTRPPASTAQEMAGRQREISIAEFFAKNRHLLGFDNPAKALLTTVKEAVDNALDACDEAGILPEILVRVEQLEEERFRVTVEDNGPGIVRGQVPKIFGKLLYGSKFHSLKQSRGQQGIGISAAGMYGALTTGKPVEITSRAGAGQPAHHFQVVINTEKNAPDTLVDAAVEWDKPHGTRVSITLQGTYKKGRHSIDGYLLQVAVANPHATIVYEPPAEEGGDGRIVYARTTAEAPVQPRAIKPHPHGVELGVFLKMLQNTSAHTLRAFLREEFSRVGDKVVGDLITETTRAGMKITAETLPRRIPVQDAEAIHSALARVKIIAPPTNCLSPIGEDLLLGALRQRVQADFATAVTRPPAVYRGNPFQIEAALAFGGDLPVDGLAEIYRYANRVPLQYQRSACAMTKAVVDMPWRNYKIGQSRGALPTGPLVLVIHIASVWVPFTSESKEAVAHYPEILHEIRLALQECGRRLGGHIGRTRRVAEEEKKHSYIQKYIPQIGIALQEILGLSDPERERTVATLTTTLERSRRM